MRTIEGLSNEELELIRRCLDAVANGPFFPDWEFRTLLGYSRDEVREVLRRWPVDNNQAEVTAVVVSALNNLTGYPHGDVDSWNRYVRAPESAVLAILRKLTASRES